MILYTKSRLRIAELHFQDTATPPAADIVRYYWRPEKIEGTRCQVFHTIFIDLRQEPASLLSAIGKTTRHEIRRADKDGLEHDFFPDPELSIVQEFFGFFDVFAKSKGLRAANRARILAMRESGALALSRIRNSGNETLVWHCYLRNRCADRQSWARLLHSASLFRAAGRADAALISRANRHHHWLDLLRFRDLGFETYDFGGWYSGRTDQDKLRINFFKEQFGGSVAQLFNADRGLTWKGALALRARRALDRLRGEET